MRFNFAVYITYHKTRYINISLNGGLYYQLHHNHYHPFFLRRFIFSKPVREDLKMIIINEKPWGLTIWDMYLLHEVMKIHRFQERWLPLPVFPKKDQLHNTWWSYTTLIGLSGTHWYCAYYINWKCQVNKALQVDFLHLCQLIYSLKFRALVLANLLTFKLFCFHLFEARIHIFSSEHISS